MEATELLLYHGTNGLDSGGIELRSNIGVGSNDITFGNGFYTSTSKEIAIFYSHIMMRERLFDLGTDPDQALTGEVYQIKLAKGFRLLKESDRLDIGASVTALKRSGISMSDISMLLPTELASFSAVVDMIELAGFHSGNPKEFLTKELGFDGLLMVQKPYLPWHYEPENIGVNWNRCWASWKTNPPATLVIYNTATILSTDLIHSGKQSSLLLHEPKQYCFGGSY